VEANSLLYTLFVRLRSRRFLIGMEDYYTLKEAMKCGFGWSSRESLRNLCSLLWAKSLSERQILEALFDQLEFPDWNLTEIAETVGSDGGIKSGGEFTEQHVTQHEFPEGDAKPNTQIGEEVPATQPKQGLPPIDLRGLNLSTKQFVFVHNLPLMSRDLAPLWRQFRAPELSGPLEEIDIEATIALRCRQGLAGPIILRPRRRKTSNVLLLIDRQGSMSPFHRFVDLVCQTTTKSVRQGQVATYYFHDVPAEGADERVLTPIADQPFPALDDVLDKIVPFETGFVYADEGLLSPVPLSVLLSRFAHGASVILLSDAGAARGRYDLQRLLDTVAFVKALTIHTCRYIWLNPLPSVFWKGTTAEQIARHVPMFSLDREGLQKASHLRWSRTVLENPL
jgi:uncharacterized protein